MDYPEPLQDYAFREITRGIQIGTYPMGVKLAPQRIAQALGISSTPVVAALNRLAAQGLVEMIPRRGAVVKKFSNQDIRNHFDTRVMMECWAVSAAIRNVERFPQYIQEMAELAEQFDYLPPDDLEIARELETRFHLLLIQLADNPQLTRLYEFNWSVGSVFFVYSLSKAKPEDLRISMREHRLIVSALKAQDEEGLRALMTDHLRFLNKALEWYK